MTQQELIENARALLQPSPVKLHHVPDWFRKRLLKVYGGQFGTSGGAALQSMQIQLRPEWLDHWGSTMFRGQLAFVAEPYGVWQAEAKQLADAIGAQIEFSANSWWFPGRTIRVAFYERAAD